MLISIVNHTKGRSRLHDEEVQRVIRAVNRQISQDYRPYWHVSADLRLEGTISDTPEDDTFPELRGDAIIYLWKEPTVDEALGFHEAHASGIPFGFVFTDLAKEMGEEWSVTLSHEALELLGDPEANRLVAGPHPSDPDKEVFHWYEMCDAVQDERYPVDGVEVSNFLLPLDFTSGAEEGGRNDFLGRLYKGKALESFGINPGGYVGFYNPETQDHETFALKSDARAKIRLATKGKASMTRRSMRYKLGTTYQRALERRVAPVVAATAPTRMPRGLRRRSRTTREVEKIDSQPKRPTID